MLKKKSTIARRAATQLTMVWCGRSNFSFAGEFVGQTMLQHPPHRSGSGDLRS
jgi:hypothetical protein